MPSSVTRNQIKHAKHVLFSPPLHCAYRPPKHVFLPLACRLFRMGKSSQEFAHAEVFCHASCMPVLRCAADELVVAAVGVMHNMH